MAVTVTVTVTVSPFKQRFLLASQKFGGLPVYYQRMIISFCHNSRVWRTDGGREINSI